MLQCVSCGGREEVSGGGDTSWVPVVRWRLRFDWAGATDLASRAKGEGDRRPRRNDGSAHVVLSQTVTVGWRGWGVRVSASE